MERYFNPLRIFLLFPVTLVSLGYPQLTTAVYFQNENVHTTEVFIKHIKPSLFGWIDNGPDQFRFHVSLKDAPDLPPWIHYKYSPKHQMGFLYGVPPAGQKSIDLELIGINFTSFDSRYYGLHLNVIEKAEKAQYEVHVKINNMNIEDIMNATQLKSLIQIFETYLWPQSGRNLYVTFLASAVDLGARLPLRPDESEGVVVRIGSEQEFSVALLNLEQEVRPLWKYTFCDFKRTTVERWFRSNNFYLDWCAFRLNNLTIKQNMKPLMFETNSTNDFLDAPETFSVPSRNFTSEFFMTLLTPVMAFIFLASFLSFILCFHHHSLQDKLSDEYFDNVFYTMEKYFRRNRDATSSKVPNDNFVNVYYAPTVHPVSPQGGYNYNVTLTPRVSEERAGQRPQPPPYSTIRRNDL